MWKAALSGATVGLIVLATTHSGSAQPLSAESLLAAQIKLNSGLIARLEKPAEPGRNVIVSPGGLAAILALLDLGVDDAMRKSMHAVLGFSGSSNAAIDFTALRATVGTVDTGIRDKDTSLALANAVVIDPTSQPITTTLDRMRATGAKIEVEDLTKQTTIDGINAWSRNAPRA
jgi:serine protease inhibitor